MHPLPISATVAGLIPGPRLFQLGNVAIPTSGVFSAIAILSALAMARITARRLSLDSEKVWDAGIAGVLAALIAPRLALIFTHWSDFRAHPLWMLGLVSVRSPLALSVGLALAAAVFAAFVFFSRLPFRSTLDAFAPGAACGAAIYWIGAFLAGSSFGRPTSLPWAAAYTSRLASIWNRTPLGTPLHPVQLYLALLALAVLAISLWLLRTSGKPRLRRGEVMGACLFLYGVGSFFLNFLRGDLAAIPIPLANLLAAAMAVLGGLLWLL
jgi:phosphatidylglycerol:prolipoprotein diacylglycerol transferase